MLFTPFRQRRQPQPQLQSSLFNLPLELRFEIYTYVFAASMVHDPQEHTWDNLLLSCRQAKLEMESLPAAPIMSMVESLWSQEFPHHPLSTFMTFKNGRVSEMCVGIPRRIFGTEPYCYHIPGIPDYVTLPLFRIYSEAFTLCIYDDGCETDWTGMMLCFILQASRQIGLFVRCPPPRRNKELMRQHLYWRITPLRRYLNTTKLVICWEGSLFNECKVRSDWSTRAFRLSEAMSSTFNRFLGRPKKTVRYGWTSETGKYTKGVSWESKRRFRR